MSVSSEVNQVIYTGSGTTGPFDFTFKIFATSDLLVQKYTIATDTSVDLTITTDYTVTIDGDNGGTVTLVSSLSSAYKLVITRVLPFTQSINYVANDPFPAETHEEGLDRGIMIDQQLQEQIDRCVKVVAGSSTTPDELVDTLTAASDAAVAAAAAAATSATTASNAAGSAVYAWGGTIGGTADAITLTPSPALASYATGIRYAFKATATNTGAATVNISGLGVKTIKTQLGATLSAGNITSGGIYSLTYDGTNFLLHEGGGSFSSDGSVGLSNFLRNGSFELWGNGTSVAPEGFTFAGAGGTIARESTTFKHGLYSAKIIRAGADCFLYNATAHLPIGITYYKGRVVTLSAWVYASVASVARLILSDGVGSSYSSYHTGNSTWQLLSVTRTIDASATKIQPECTVDTSNATCYFDGMMCVEGASIFASTPNPNTDYVVAFQSEKAASNQTLSTGTLTKLVLEDDTSNTNFYFDVGGDFDGPNSKFTARIAGVYQFYVKVEATSGLVAAKTFRCQLYLNGAGATSQNNVINVATPATQSFMWPFTVKLAVGDYVEFYGYQDTGGNVVLALSYSYVSGFLVGRV